MVAELSLRGRGDIACIGVFAISKPRKDDTSQQGSDDTDHT